MPDGGTVTVEVSNATLDRRYAALHPDVTPGPYVLVAVNDTGTGMPPEVAAQAFDPFFTTKRDGKGTGLGLSMVYGFVRQSNGHIRIDSAIGQGTSVKLYLPRTLDPVAELPADGGQRAGRQRARPGGRGQRRGQARRGRHADRLGLPRRRGGESRRRGGHPGEGRRPSTCCSPMSSCPGSMSAIELAAMAQRRRPGIAVLLTSGYARDLIPVRGPAGLSDDRQALSRRGADGEAAQRAGGAPAAAGGAGQAAGARRKLAAGRRSGRPRRVLLVEDEVVLRMSTTDMLEQLGCFVAGVGSGEQALELLARGGSFDLLVTDLGLPGMSGEELAARGPRRSSPSLPVVIASGYGRSAQSQGGGPPVHFQALFLGRSAAGARPCGAGMAAPS